MPGKTVHPVKEEGETKKRGTKVTFSPDDKIFSILEYDYGVLLKRFRELAFLNKGIEISKIIKLEQQRPKNENDKNDIVMDMDYLIKNIRNLPDASQALEEDILRNTAVQRESGAYTAEIAQNSRDATREIEGELVVDFYLHTLYT